jgi:uncharacterized protein YcgI (DUF1989 family)
MEAVHSTETSVNVHTYYTISYAKFTIVRASDFMENVLNDENSVYMIAKLLTPCEMRTNQNFL